MITWYIIADRSNILLFSTVRTTGFFSQTFPQKYFKQQCEVKLEAPVEKQSNALLTSIQSFYSWTNKKNIIFP